MKKLVLLLSSVLLMGASVAARSEVREPMKTECNHEQHQHVCQEPSFVEERVVYRPVVQRRIVRRPVYAPQPVCVRPVYVQPARVPVPFLQFGFGRRRRAGGFFGFNFGI